MNNPITLVVVDDDQLITEALSLLCAKIDGVQVLGQAISGRDGLALVEKTRPRVALVDLRMAEIDGIEFALHVRAKRLPTRLVIITGHADDQCCVRAMRAGVAGYLLKGSAVDELETAIYSVANGNGYITPEMACAFRKHPDDMPQPERLTLRHREVLQLVVDGKTNKEIAGRLDVAVKTVESHRAELMRRLGVENTAALVSYAIAHRLVMASDYKVN